MPKLLQTIHELKAEHDAKQHLAAAAPDLLAALDKILGEISVRGSISRDDWRVESARAAIAKATGEA